MLAARAWTGKATYVLIRCRGTEDHYGFSSAPRCRGLASARVL
ncbi:MAG TPA: hypothetical protein VMV41_08565 [Cellulomonadaceae bacterium]|nr:hypothetical protein [Cellulomonadaceae bacterium]